MIELQFQKILQTKCDSDFLKIKKFILKVNGLEMFKEL